MIIGFFFLCLFSFNISQSSIFANIFNNKNKSENFQFSYEKTNNNFEKAPLNAKSIDEFKENPSDVNSEISEIKYTDFPNGGFEKYEYENPYIDNFVGWNHRTNNDFNASLETTNPAPVEGTYSLKMEFFQIGTTSSFRSIYQYLSYPYPSINQNATLGFNWYIQSNYIPNLAEDYGYIQVSFNDSRSIRYVFLGNISYAYATINITTINNTNQIGSWNFELRNITEDYIDSFGSPSNDVGITNIQIGMYLLRYTGEHFTIYADNITVKENTIDIINNGGFETKNSQNLPSDWYIANYAHGESKASDFVSTIQRNNDPNAKKDGILPDLLGHTQKSLEMKWNINESSSITWTNLGVASYNDGLRYDINENNSLYFEFDYYLPSQAILNELFSYDIYINFQFTNGTNYFYYYYYIATDSLNANSSSNIYCSEDTPKEQWARKEFSLNDIISKFNITSANLTSIALNLYIGSLNQTNASVYFDNLNLRTEVFIDNDFENPGEGLYTGKGIRGWSTTNTGMHISYSTDAYSGDYSALISNSGNRDSYFQIASFVFPISALLNETNLQVHYKIPEFFANSSNDNIRIIMDLYYYNNTYAGRLIYILAQGSNIGIINDSSNIVYQVKEYNTTGTWLKFSRNIYYDLLKLRNEEALKEIYLSSFYVYIESNTAQEISLLIDDLKIGSSIPEIENTSYTPTNVGYTEDINFQIDLWDLGEITDVVLFYQLERSNGTLTPWSSNILHKSSNYSENEQIYDLVLENSIFEYNDTIYYYYVIKDILGNEVIYPSNANSTGSSNLLSIQILDKLNPKIINVSTEKNLYTILEKPTINVIVDDGQGSGMKSVIIYYSLDHGNNWTSIIANKQTMTAEQYLLNQTNNDTNKISEILNNSINPQLYAAQLADNFTEYDFMLFYIFIIDNVGNVNEDKNNGYYYNIRFMPQPEPEPEPPKYSNWDYMGFGAVLTVGLYIVSKIGWAVHKKKKNRAKEKERMKNLEKKNSKLKKNDQNIKPKKNNKKK